MEQPKVYSRYNAPKGLKSAAGEKIYKYKYKDKDGHIQTAEKNIYEKIQSCRGLADYKTRIQNGEELINNEPIGESIRDFRAVPTNKVDIINLINAVGNMDQDQIANLVKQATQSSQENSAGAKPTPKELETTRENLPESSADVATGSGTTKETGGTK